MRSAFELARSRSARVTSVGMDALVAEAAERHQGVHVEHLTLAETLPLLMHTPERFDVVVCDTLFVEALSDMAAYAQEGKRLVASGRLSTAGPGIFGPTHGSALEIAGMARPERLERARHFISLVGLNGFERRYPAELSGGMRQRVSMARTLASEPKIMLMDEPFAALDEQTRLLLGDKVLQIQQTLKQTTLLITHNITEAVQLSDRILVMTYRPGRLKRMVDIKLPRPRTSEIVSSEAFGRYVAQIWNDLREEATLGLREDEASKLQRSGKP